MDIVLLLLMGIRVLLEPVTVQQAMPDMLHTGLLWERRRMHAGAIIVCSGGWRHSGRGGGEEYMWFGSAFLFVKWVGC
ncbi:hypothetical protein BZA05DRAFT_392261 [Tricharina praecox]|uniref:uncharacterized protein n=1 Tax=Tricharina praecox TaxID=43433 RepID=UPI002220C76C|nr:uncharacterized protein BZA05DRAFT_392261 [Tricharina praecox]KAI5854691.1 hypothetical protein BZA05DRAFT_392261 [Tricharina praecox]